MRQAYLWLLPLLLTESFSLEAHPLPRKNNIVSNYLNKILNSLYEQLTTSKLSIPEIDLGENTGKFTEVEVSVPGKAEKIVDGVKGFGFTLDTNLTKIVIAGHYDLVHLDVPGLFPFFGNGKFCITLDMVNINMTLTADYDMSDEKFNIDIPDLQILIQNSTVEFENLMNDPHLSDFLNELLTKLLPDVVKTISKPLIELAMPLIDYFGNGIIKCIKTGVLLGNIEECIKNLFIKELTDEMGNELSINLSKLVNFEQSNL